MVRQMQIAMYVFQTLTTTPRGNAYATRITQVNSVRNTRVTAIHAAHSAMDQPKDAAQNVSETQYGVKRKMVVCANQDG